MSNATLVWGRQWPPQPRPNVHPPPRPVLTLRASAYELLVSRDGRTWTVAARVSGRTTGITDVLRFPPVRARYVRLRIAAATHHTPPLLDELTIRR
jgi:hypothetical protein